MIEKKKKAYSEMPMPKLNISEKAKASQRLSIYYLEEALMGN
jgi:hypothetical protein